MPEDLARLLSAQAGVIARRQALRHLSEATLRHKVESGRWRLAHRAVYVAHTGPLTTAQHRWIALLAAGSDDACLAGITALRALGLRGFDQSAIHVLIPASVREQDPPDGVVIHRSAHLPGRDVAWIGRLPCTVPERSVVDAAQWATTDDEARTMIAAAFQQRLVINAHAVERVVARMPRAKRRGLALRTIAEAAGGAHSVPEMEFLRICRRHRLPRPTLQVRRVDSTSRRRYLDAYFEAWRIHVEVDGGHHMDVRSWWEDMRRQNNLWIPGDRVLRFPAWAVRNRPTEVAAQLRAALWAAGWRPTNPDLGG